MADIIRWVFSLLPFILDWRTFVFILNCFFLSFIKKKNEMKNKWNEIRLQMLALKETPTLSATAAQRTAATRLQTLARRNDIKSLKWAPGIKPAPTSKSDWAARDAQCLFTWGTAAPHSRRASVWGKPDSTARLGYAPPSSVGIPLCNLFLDTVVCGVTSRKDHFLNCTPLTLIPYCSQCE